MENVVTPAIQYLQGRQISHRIFLHQGQVKSLEQAARERSQQPQQVVRSIVFRLGEGDFVMVLVAGPGQIPWKALRHELKQSRLTMASEDELLEVTGYRPGTVNPFGLPHPMRILVDRSVLKQPEVSLGAGQQGVAILITPQSLLSALDQPEIVDLRTE